MNSFNYLLVTAGACVFLTGCETDPNKVGLTNPHQPGPAVGRAVGTAVGAVGGNAAGAVVGFHEGVVSGAPKPFDNTRREVRVWRQTTAPDGRVIQVPVDVEVDQYGQPLQPPSPLEVKAPESQYSPTASLCDDLERGFPDWVRSKG